MPRPPPPRRPAPSGSRPGSCGSRSARTAAPRPPHARRGTRRCGPRQSALGAAAVLTGHTLDDQAETVLLGLARGSGAASLQGMAPVAELADGTRWCARCSACAAPTTRAACAAQDSSRGTTRTTTIPRFARVRVRQRVLPVLEAELGPGIAEALARTAEQLREDAEAFDEMIDETIEDIVEHAEAGISVSVPALAANPAALRHRIIRHVVAAEFGQSSHAVADARGRPPRDGLVRAGPDRPAGMPRPPRRRATGAHGAADRGRLITRRATAS